MSSASRLFRTLVLGLLFGALILGAGGRLVMRLLALSVDRPVGFSSGGTLEIVGYGALVGLAGGVIKFASKSVGEGLRGGILVGLITYGLAIGTLPDHIADTARPFADRMWLVHMLFGATFLAFGIALAKAAGSSVFAKAADHY